MLKYEEWLQSVGDLQDQIKNFFLKTKYLDQEQVYIPDLVPTSETM